MERMMIKFLFFLLDIQLRQKKRVTYLWMYRRYKNHKKRLINYLLITKCVSEKCDWRRCCIAVRHTSASPSSHEGNTTRKIMGNKPQVSSAIIIHRHLQISWNDLLYQGQTADVSIIRAKTGTFSIETLIDVHLAPWWEAWFGLIRSSRHTSFVAYERG
jgi:hypothetical protein